MSQNYKWNERVGYQELSIKGEVDVWSTWKKTMAGSQLICGFLDAWLWIGCCHQTFSLSVSVAGQWAGMQMGSSWPNRQGLSSHTKCHSYHCSSLSSTQQNCMLRVSSPAVHVVPGPSSLLIPLPDCLPSPGVSPPLRDPLHLLQSGCWEYWNDVCKVPGLVLTWSAFRHR